MLISRDRRDTTPTASSTNLRKVRDTMHPSRAGEKARISQLGDGTRVKRVSPVRMDLSATATDISTEGAGAVEVEGVSATGGGVFATDGFSMVATDSSVEEP
jgi:hypothetical protein